ncbi:hypothetical protein ABIB25_005441 [Nakamurella sp. UYEF19]|uniref:hypothetical protein n=1 Tax=Nakamurella sp. UYEF19 TaxID=1756392 RepID=UPI0033969DDB
MISSAPSRGSLGWTYCSTPSIPREPDSHTWPRSLGHSTVVPEVEAGAGQDNFQSTLARGLYQSLGQLQGSGWGGKFETTPGTFKAFSVIDEMQDVASSVLSALIAAAREAGQRDLPFYLIGGGLPSCPRVLAEAKSYAERPFECHTLGHLDAPKPPRHPAQPATVEGARS